MNPTMLSKARSPELKLESHKNRKDTDFRRLRKHLFLLFLLFIAVKMKYLLHLKAIATPKYIHVNHHETNKQWNYTITLERSSFCYSQITSCCDIIDTLIKCKCVTVLAQVSSASLTDMLCPEWRWQPSIRWWHAGQYRFECQKCIGDLHDASRWLEIFQPKQQQTGKHWRDHSRHNKENEDGCQQETQHLQSP